MKNEILSLVKDYASEKLVDKKFIPGKTRIPASAPSLIPEDIEMLTEAVLQFWYTEYKFCAKFSRELGRVFKADYVTLCNSGSSASLLWRCFRTGIMSLPVELTFRPLFLQSTNVGKYPSI